jgi:SAM-dependent methyltransferase
MSERQESRHRWATVARGWEARADAFRRNTMPVSSWMVDAIGPQPGQSVLDLAAGIGDTGFLAAELVEPGGTLITSDFVPEMLSAAQRRAEALGIRNARFRQLDAETIDIEAASLDGVLCRWGYMLMTDAEAALRETRRVLRPGARVALAAWTAAEDNRWSSAPVDQLVARGRIDRAPQPGPGQFAWAREGIVAEHLDAVGFVEYEVEVVDFAMRYTSVEDWWDASRTMGMMVGEAAAGMDAAEEADLIAALGEEAGPWTADDGSLTIPARTWVASGTG